MKNIVHILKLLSDESRLRILMVLMRKELCVCQIMGVLGISQPLISRNLSLLSKSGILSERRDGKLIFYSLKEPMPAVAQCVVDVLKKHLRENKAFQNDLRSLEECNKYQKKTGKCDMKTFLAYMGKKTMRTMSERKKHAA